MKAGDAVETGGLEAAVPVPPSEGFVLEEVELKGFMRYVERTDPPLRFPEKFTAITGRTGAGKSSILDAITFALFGSTTRTDIQSVKTSDICRPGGYVRIAFRHGESRWEAKRGFTTRKDSYFDLLRDGEAIHGTIAEKEQTIKDVVGLDYVGFRNATFVRQEEMKDLGSARGADRLAIFQNLFRLEIFERALVRAKEQLDDLRHQIDVKEADISARLEGLQRLPKAREELDAIRNSIAAETKNVAGHEATLARAESDLKAREAGHEAWVKLRASQEDRRGQIQQLTRKAEEILRKGEESAKLEKERVELDAMVHDLDELRLELDGLKERSQLRRQREIAARGAEAIFNQTKHDHERRRDLIKDRLDEIHRKIAGLHTELDQDAAFNLLRDEGRLEERVVRIAREIEWLAKREDLVGELTEERERAVKALGHVREKVGSISGDSFLLSELKRQVDVLKDDLKREADESHATLQPLDDAKIAALRQLDEVPFSDSDNRRLEALAKLVPEMAALRKRLEEIVTKLREIGDVAGILAELAKQRETLATELASLEAKAKELESGEETYQKARAEIDHLRKILEEARRTLHTLEGHANQLVVQIKGFEVDGDRLRESERQRDELRAAAEIHEILVSRVFHKRGVVMYAIDQLLPELEVEASKNLAELTAGRFNRIKLETYEEGRGHGIRILVQGVDAGWHDVGEFSGGEKTQINAALRFAIARELAAMPQIGRTYGRMKTLFIDEGDLGSLDTEVSRELFVQKLFRMGEFFEKVILITHLAEVAERFPGRIQVTMTPSQESRVEVLA